MIRLMPIIAVALLSCSAHATDQKNALQTFYEALGGTQWKRSDGWLTDSPIGTWYGIVTEGEYVTEINLADNGLTGELPWEIADLSHLEHLDLRWNALSGDIPHEFGKLFSLKTMLLTGNKLTGEVPWTFGALSKLERLDLSRNHLVGEIPPEFGDLNSLQSLGLHHNTLTGTIPWKLSRISTLKRLVLNGNRLSGSIPPEFVEMDGLVHLNIYDNPSDAQSSVGKEVFQSIGTKSGKAIRGGAAFDETTHIIDDPRVRQLIETTMNAVWVQDGTLHLEMEMLPEGVDPGRFQEGIHAVNERLREANERVHSLGDLERALEIYGSHSIAVPETVSEKTFTSGTDSRGQRSTGFAIVVCPDFKAHHAHASATTPGKITGKAGGSCTYTYGPPQSITYNAYSYLQKWSGWWLFAYWKQVGELAHSQESGIRVTFQQNRLVAVTECSNDLYRTRAAMYIIGSVSGKFHPHPGLYASAQRYISC